MNTRFRLSWLNTQEWDQWATRQVCVQLLIRSRPILWMSKLRARERKQLTWHTPCETVQPGASYLIIHSPNKFPFIHNIYWRLHNTPFGLPAVKNLPVSAGDVETRVQPLCRGDTLEEEMATYRCSCLGNPVVRGAWRAAVCGCKELDKA